MGCIRRRWIGRCKNEFRHSQEILDEIAVFSTKISPSFGESEVFLQGLSNQQCSPWCVGSCDSKQFLRAEYFARRFWHNICHANWRCSSTFISQAGVDMTHIQYQGETLPVPTSPLPPSPLVFAFHLVLGKFHIQAGWETTHRHNYCRCPCGIPLYTFSVWDHSYFLFVFCSRCGHHFILPISLSYYCIGWLRLVRAHANFGPMTPFTFDTLIFSCTQKWGFSFKPISPKICIWSALISTGALSNQDIEAASTCRRQ